MIERKNKRKCVRVEREKSKWYNKERNTKKKRWTGSDDRRKKANEIILNTYFFKNEPIEKKNPKKVSVFCIQTEKRVRVIKGGNAIKAMSANSSAGSDPGKEWDYEDEREKKRKSEGEKWVGDRDRDRGREWGTW